MAIAAALLVAAGLVWHGVYGAFSATTNSSGNSWASATVSLSDDDGGAALFALAGLQPGSTGSNCVLVTYAATVPSEVRLYTQNYTGALGGYLTMTVQSGSGTTCAAFGAATTLFTGVLSALCSARTDFTTGLAVPWTPTTNGAAKPYKFTYTMGDDNAALGTTAGVDFVWEAQST